MWSDSNYDYIWQLKYKVKHLNDLVESFKSGQIYLKMESDHKNEIHQHVVAIKKLNKEVTSLRTHNKKIVKDWSQVNDDLYNEFNKTIKIKDRKIKKQDKLINELYQKIDSLQDSNNKLVNKISVLSLKLEDEEGKNQKLTAQINRDFENSSIPSSLKTNHKKVHNGRKKTNNKVGGQPKHKGHTRKKQTPTNVINMDTPIQYLDTTKYRPTKNIISKQLVNVEVRLVVDEYRALEYRNIKTGQRVHAQFPQGVVNEVNYGGSIKAFAFLLNNHCNVSIGKTSEFISELTDGKLSISTGMINNLSKQFSLNTEEQRKEAFMDLLTSPVMHVDFTTANVNGQGKQVAICADSEGRKVGYYARNHKGHKGIVGTPVETYLLTLVHDHDLTFYKYGSEHQECVIHTLRYVRDSIDNESHLEWNTKMYKIIQDMIHYSNGVDEIDEGKVKDLIERYDKCLTLATSEYEDNPPTKYYKEGYNLYKRLVKYKKEHLLFLNNPNVPTNNNRVERLARVFKRKQRAMTTFRSFESFEYLCNALGIIQSIKTNEENIYNSITNIFNT